MARNPYPHSFEHNKEINGQVNELLEAGIIEPAASEWAAPLIVVPKPTRNGLKEWRMCVDYRGLNARIICT